MTEQTLENFYREHLEEDIVFELGKRNNLSNDQSLELYYTSRLADHIHRGSYGIQYLDYHVLTDYLEDELQKAKVSSNF